MARLRLVVFDVDGTLVDSEADIHAAMTRAFDDIGQYAPDRADVRSIVGLSLDEAFARLAPELADQRADLVDAYRAAYFDLRREKGAAETSPLFPGARAVLDQLRAQPWTLLAVATGKSKRGLDKLIEAHGLDGYFASIQVSDFHPSKPHPSMLHAALTETGVAVADAVMVGDTSFDMDMARAAGLASIGVGWGYHAVDQLGADVIISNFAELPGAVDGLLTHGNEATI